MNKKENSSTVELLSPARNLEFGKQALWHGADAVYIGAPRFGARAAVGNTVSDIASLCQEAHRYRARVYVALNTILRDEEVESARTLAWELYDAGADALIIQDTGLLELDMPPLALHASTQMDNRSVEKVRFLHQVGFSQVVLARELTIDEITRIASEVPVTLEAFVHGALCVSYSGQCYLSQAQCGRSANRGECAQPCRLPYTLKTHEGEVLGQSRHYLSLKDNHQGHHLHALLQAGVRSLKIEGRLKDLSYVKNITAYYRQHLDKILENHPQWSKASSGRCEYTFEPAPEKTFQRGLTDYFAAGRAPDMASLDSPKFTGEAIGSVTRTSLSQFELQVENPDTRLANGDGLAYFDSHSELGGLRLNRVESLGNGRWRAWPGHAIPLPLGTRLFRNHDQSFERLLESKSAQRRIPLTLILSASDEKLTLTLDDLEGHTVSVEKKHPVEIARHPEKKVENENRLSDLLRRLGETIFLAEKIEIRTQSIRLQESGFFVPPSVVNELRREGIHALEQVRLKTWRPLPSRQLLSPSRRSSEANFPTTDLDFTANVFNEAAFNFYLKHGVKSVSPAFELRWPHDNQKTLPDWAKNHPSSRGNATPSSERIMTTRYCVRQVLHACPKEQKGTRPDPLWLEHGKERLQLVFDCRRCEMHVYRQMK